MNVIQKLPQAVVVTMIVGVVQNMQGKLSNLSTKPSLTFLLSSMHSKCCKAVVFESRVNRGEYYCGKCANYCQTEEVERQCGICGAYLERDNFSFNWICPCCTKIASLQAKVKVLESRQELLKIALTDTMPMEVNESVDPRGKAYADGFNYCLKLLSQKIDRCLSSTPTL